MTAKKNFLDDRIVNPTDEQLRRYLEKGRKRKEVEQKEKRLPAKKSNGEKVRQK